MLKVALVGRTNVGKSTLFNCLTRRRDALVADEAELTRDRRYGCVEEQGQRWLLIDTGGLIDVSSAVNVEVAGQMIEQTERAIDEADLICLVADAREGLTAADEIAVQRLRRMGKRSWLVVNKVDRDQYAAEAEFASLGLHPCFYTAALQQRGIKDLRQAMAKQAAGYSGAATSSGVPLPDDLRVSFLGRPNVGKSTLLNCLVGKPRVLASEAPGTTRDSVFVPFEFNGDRFVLIDTAGVRRRSKVDNRIESFSVMKALESVMLSDVVVLVCDAGDGVTTQDASLAARVISAGRGLVIAVNKQDLVTDTESRHLVDRSLDLRFRFLSGIKAIELSALLNRGMKRLMYEVRRAYESTRVHVPTPMCTRLLNSAVQRNQPPLVGGKQVKLRYAHQGGTCPPRFIAHGSRVDRLPASYRRYLENFFRDRLRLVGTPVVFEFRRTSNRFVE